MQKGKNICIFIDGTCKDGNSNEPTNVKLLHDATSRFTHGKTQKIRYFQGVGTENFHDANKHHNEILRKASKLETWRFVKTYINVGAGSIFGFGTSFNIREAYSFLCGEYDRQWGDRIFIFGFSRGAFAARSLAGFVDTVGVLLKNRLDLVEAAFAIYRDKRVPDGDLRKSLEKLTKTKVSNETNLPVHFVGVWDTVAALGMTPLKSFRKQGIVSFHDGRIPEYLSCARQALAIHEFRTSFEPELWDDFSKNTKADVIQMWFSGSHSDVGGGYGIRERALANESLHWMAGEANKQGLGIDIDMLNTYPTGASENPQIFHWSKEETIFKFLPFAIRTGLKSLSEKNHCVANKHLDLSNYFGSLSLHSSFVTRIITNEQMIDKGKFTPEQCLLFEEADNRALATIAFCHHHQLEESLKSEMPECWWVSFDTYSIRNANNHLLGFVIEHSHPSSDEIRAMRLSVIMVCSVNYLKPICARIIALFNQMPGAPFSWLSDVIEQLNDTSSKRDSDFREEIHLQEKLLCKLGISMNSSTNQRCDLLITMLHEIFEKKHKNKRSELLAAIDATKLFLAIKK